MYSACFDSKIYRIPGSRWQYSEYPFINHFTPKMLMQLISMYRKNYSLSN